jgi:hypothetical protein
MKKIKFICSILILIVAASGCTKIEGLDQDLSFLNTVGSSNPSKIFDISNDNSGNVKITPMGDGVASFKVEFGHGTGTSASTTLLPGNNATHSYPEGSYTVTITAYDLAGVSTVSTYPLTVTYRAPEDVTIKIESDVVVSVTAKYAKSFIVYYGDVANEVGIPLAVGAKLPAHIYPAGGPYTMKVVALSGGVAQTTVNKTLFGTPIDYENADVNYFFGTFGTGQLFATVDNPDKTGLNTTLKVGKFTRGTEGWSGTYSPLDIPMNFAQGNKVKVLVYNPDAAFIGKKLNVELESAVGGSPANGVAIKKVAVTTSGAWEELVFDFSAVSGITTTSRFNQLVLRYNDSGATPGAIIYIDNIRFTN